MIGRLESARPLHMIKPGSIRSMRIRRTGSVIGHTPWLTSGHCREENKVQTKGSSVIRRPAITQCLLWTQELIRWVTSDASLFHRMTQKVFLFQLQSYFLCTFQMWSESTAPMIFDGNSLLFVFFLTLNAASTLFLSVQIDLMTNEFPRALGIHKDAVI